MNEQEAIEHLVARERKLCDTYRDRYPQWTTADLCSVGLLLGHVQWLQTEVERLMAALQECEAERERLRAWVPDDRLVICEYADKCEVKDDIGCVDAKPHQWTAFCAMECSYYSGRGIMCVPVDGGDSSD